MNAHALLTSQGWLGSGHALDSRLTDYGAPTYKQKGHRGLAYDPTSTSSVTTGNGLVKPLLVSQRNGTGARFGIGKKVHEPASGNDWWLKGFQTALSNIGKSESERTSVATSGASTPAVAGGFMGKHGGLYGYFTAGQLMHGTIGSDDESEQDERSERRGKKRKSDVLDENTSNPVQTVSVKGSATAKELESSLPYLAERDKSRRKGHVRTQSTDVEQFAMVGQFLGASGLEEDINRRITSKDMADSEGRSRGETAEERRARRRRRKEERTNGKLTLAQMVEEEMAKLSSMNNSEADAAEESSGNDNVNAKNTKPKRRSKRDKE